MKKLSLLALAAAGLLMVGCSEKDTEVAQEGTDVLKEKGVGFFKVNINLPDDAPTTTRGWNEDNTHLKDGKATEWKVNNALLVIFSGASESAATVAQVNTLTGTWNDVTANNPNQVTKNHEEVVQLTASTSSKLFALAVINGTGIIEAEGNTLKVKNGTAMETATTIADLQAAIAQANATTGANTFVNPTDSAIFMTNAVLSNVRGGKIDPSTNPAMHILAAIDSKYIYETEAAAQAGTPATDIYVERGVAKVTINKNNLAVNGPVISGTTTAPAMTFNGWCLDNTNTQSYVVRNVPAYTADVFSWNYFNVSCAATNDKYRFVGNTPVDAEYSTATAGYRTYWAVDPNYTTKTVPLFQPTLDGALSTKVGETCPQYCYENTFDVDHQSYQNTTAVIVKVTLGNGSDFYTVGADRKTLYSSDDVETMIVNVLMGLSDFKTWFETTVGNTTTSLTKDDITVTWDPDAAGVVEVEDITVTITVGETPTNYKVSTLTGGSTYLSTINAQVANIKRYVGGATYYAIRIKHFGDDLTPWADIAVGGVKPAESTIDKIYPGTGDVRNAAYLGRYGVVRNNWYDLDLNEIVKIGAATPEELRTKEHPDDDLEDSFIKARINILSWAKRPQTWNLK
jgi:hypothetical protein